MSVAGIDFGNLNLLIGQAGKGGVDIILNGASNRQNATAVSIQGKQRFIGDAGANMAKSNILNTVQGMKLLVGRQFDDADVQRELARHPFRAGKMPHGGVGVYVTYDDQETLLSAEHYMAMLLVMAKEISEQANGGASIGDAVLAVPHWFTNAQRRGVQQACEIAQLNVLKITNESNAIALSFGIFKSAKKLFSETDNTYVMFADMGYTGFCATIVAFKQEHMTVLSTVCDREVSGRAFDDELVEFLAEKFQAATGIDVRKNKKAMLKLQAAAEKAKKTLSPAGVTEAAVNVECVAEDRDLNTILLRSELEKRISPYVERTKACVEQALREAGLQREQLAETEIIGGSTRIALVKKVLGEALGLDPAALNHGLKTTMNADEAVARGCALQCAMLSSRMKVKPFHIVDRMAYGIEAVFENEHHASKSESVSLYQRNDEIPHKPRRITFRNKTSDFSVTLQYDEAAAALLPQGESRFIGKYTVRMPANSEPRDVRVTFNLDKHNIVHVQSAELLEPLSEEESKKDEAADSKKDEAKDEDAGKKKFKKVALHVDVEEPGLSKEQVKEALELEARMAYEDRLITETADKKNEVESYIYNMRDKLDGPLKAFAAPAEKDSLKALMSEIENWLYDEGYETTKQEYERKLAELKKSGGPIEHRAHQQAQRPAAIDSLKKQIEMCKAFTANYDEAHAHITEEDRDRVRKETQNTEDWLYDLIGKQGEQPLHAEPVLTVELITAKRNALFAVANPVMTKPKPKPEAKPAPTPAEKESKPAAEEKKEEGNAEETKAESK